MVCAPSCAPAIKAGTLPWRRCRTYRSRASAARASRPTRTCATASRRSATRRKKAIQALQKQINVPSAQALADLHTTAPAMQALLALTLDFGAAYAAEKRRRSLVDFSDLEHMTAQLLTDDDGAPTELARQLSGRYTEIMVDEYQDVSEVQDLIFRAVSRDGNNLFFVGDVKQSIYRFRLADPTIFLDKYARFADFRAALPGAPRRILLRENFRSRRAVLEGANHVFSNIMSRALGELDYDDAARLRAGAPYPDDGEKPELAVLELPDADDDAPTPEKAALEADYVARRIRALIDGGASVWENGAERPAHYGDVVILLRSANSVGPMYRAALEAQGIPVSAETSGGFYTSEEVSVLCSLLAVVDNPHQDVPLIAALRSPLFGLTADDLAAVRTCDREHDFYTAVTLAAETRDDCRDFLDVLARYRALSIELPLGEFLWHVVDDRAVMALTSAMPDGELRRRNVLLLLDLAQQFERTGARGLHRFLLWMQRQAAEGEEPTVPGSESRSVRILSIHKSKGLEFPFVFFVRHGAPVQQIRHARERARAPGARPRAEVHGSRARRGVPHHRTAGDRGAAADRDALGGDAPAVRGHDAREGAPHHHGHDAQHRQNDRLAGGHRERAAPAGAAARHGQPPVLAAAERAARPGRALPAPELRLSEARRRGRARGDGDRTRAAGARPRPAGTARARAHVPLRARAGSRPAVKGDGDGAQAAGGGGCAARGQPARRCWRARRARRPFAKPDFSARARKLTAAERGTATHRILQYLHFADARTPEGIRAQVETLTARGELTGREAQAVDTASLLRLGRTELGAQLAAAEAAGTLRREFRFSLLCPAETFFPNAGDEQVLLQGVVDAWFETKDGLVIVDYKTDRIRPEGVLKRARRTTPRSCAPTPGRWRASPASRSAAACCIFCTAARSATCRARMRKKMRKPLAILSPVC